MGTMNGSFTMELLVDKLSKLNNSQQSIETLSHWCVFHRSKAKQVVEAWNQQFYCSPRDQRVSFLYLANDILQNSRRKGWEFVGEFWKVLPDALNDVTVNGDTFGKSAVLRLLHIWEERKVFGSHGHTLREELLGRNGDGRNKNGTAVIYKLKHPAGDMLEKLVSCYEHISDGLVDEEVLFRNSQSAIDFVEKLENDTGSCFNTGNIKGSGTVDQLQGKHKILRECVEKLKAVESYRSTMLSHLIDALREQEFKLDQVRKQLQAAQSRHDQVGNICQQSLSHNSGHSLSEPRLKDSPSAFYGAPSNFTSEAPVSNGEQFIPASYTEHAYLINSTPCSEDENRRTDAATADRAQLTASISSEQVFSSVLSSLDSGVIDQSMTENNPFNSKKVKLNGVHLHSPTLFQPQPPHPPFPPPDSLDQPPPPPPPPPFPPPDSLHQPPPPPPPPPFPHPDSFHQPPPPSSPMPLQLPPPETLPSPIQHPPAPPDTFSPLMLHPPPLPDAMPPMPLPPLLPCTIPFMQTVRPMTGMPYFYTSPHPLQRPPSISSYTIGMPACYPIIPTEPFYTSQGAEGVVFGQPPQPTGSPSVSHQ